jgi:murein DD-endopeptidase MepM/ murein hydrolase activator NlpD
MAANGLLPFLDAPAAAFLSPMPRKMGAILQRRSTSLLRWSVAILAVLSLRCTATLPTAFALQSGPEVSVTSRAPRPSSRRLFVVQGRVNAERRVVVDGKPGSTMDPRVGACAREFARRGALRPGTLLRAVYADERGLDDTATPGTLVAVEMEYGKDIFRAYATRAGGDFYTADGKPLGASFLRYPLPFIAVTSGFDPSRKHPLLHRRKPHLGVDFAARRGTPVLAVADGRVLDAGWSTGFGRRVRIAHDDGFESAYSHLDRYGPLVVENATVRKGEVIGYVGATGLATGPHLHFSLIRNGRHVDPLTVALPGRPTLTGTELAHLGITVTEVELALSRLDPREAGLIEVASVAPYR